MDILEPHRELLIHDIYNTAHFTNFNMNCIMCDFM